MPIEKIMKRYIPMTETAFYILLSLKTPRHGYGIIKNVEEMTNGRLILGSGTIYGTLTKMQKDGMISVYADEDRKKIYEVTDVGKAVMQQEIKRLEELYANALENRGAFE